MKLILCNVVKSIAPKGKIAHNKQFLLLAQCFQGFSAADAAICGKGLNKTFSHLYKLSHDNLMYIEAMFKYDVSTHISLQIYGVGTKL